MSKPYIIGFIFARGGSKGIPRKNILPLAGKPLIAYAIETARSCQLIDRVVVSTDDQEIADVARQWGAEIPFMRPSELAQDDSPEWLAWQHAIKTLADLDKGGQKLDVFVAVPVTAPFRHVEDLEACIETLLDGDADMVITVTRATHNPYFNMVVLDDRGYASVAMQPSVTVYRRQDAPIIYDMTTVAYAARPEFIMQSQGMFTGKVKAVVVPPERALDIDTMLDFEFAEFLIHRSSGER